jgi:hypothetical protein
MNWNAGRSVAPNTGSGLRRSTGLSLCLAASLWLALPVAAEPHAQASSPPSVGHLPGPSPGQTLEGAGTATQQGGLVDIRYGQVCLDGGGSALVLEVPENCLLTLDAVKVSAEQLLTHIPEGLSAVISFDTRGGIAQAVEAFSGGATLPALASRTLPAVGPAYGPGELVTILLPAAEVARLSGPSTVSIPGVARDLPLLPAQGGGAKVMFRVQPGMDFFQLPVFVCSRDTVYRAGRLNLATTAPTVIDYGPSQASVRLASIPGWVDVWARTPLLDPTSARLTVSPGLRVQSFQPGVGRSNFELEADGPGEHWIEFSMQDQLGRTVRQRWPLRVLP